MNRLSLNSSFGGVNASRAAGVAVVAALLIGSGGVAAEKRSVEKKEDQRTVVHVLNRVAFGPGGGDVARAQAMGIANYIEEQLQPRKIADGAMQERLAKFQTVGMTSQEIGERYQDLEELRRELQLRQGEREEQMANLTPEQRQRLAELRKQNQQVLGELAEQKLLRAVYSDRQLEEVLVDFWFNHFNVFAGKGVTRIYLTEYERDAIRPHVLGKFRDLLGATAQSPAMLFYLDNWQSSDPDAGANARSQQMMRRNQQLRRNPQIRRNPQAQARRIPAAQPDAQMQDPQMQDPQTQPPQQQAQRPRRGINENYARELMELHTLGVGGGYTQQDIVEVAKAFTGWTIQQPRRGGAFQFDERRHVKGAKKILGKTIDKGGVDDGEAVLDLLAAHPSTAMFIATKLTRRFVSDDPPKALVARVAAKFRSTNGDLREVVRTILTSPEFTSAEAMRAKVKTPFEFVASALRATGARVDDGAVLVRNLQGLGMPLYMAQPPTGYIDRSEVWVNTGALLNRMNFAIALVNNKLRGVQVDLSPIIGRNPPEVAAARDALVASLLSNDISDSTRATIEKGGEVTQVAALTLGSPEFQRR